MKILLVYPAFPPSFWGHTYALELLGKRGTMPPLGLLTIAAMFPPSYSVRLVDLNIEVLTDDDLLWADYVGISSMIVQKNSREQIVRRCNEAGVPVFVGGPEPTVFYDEIEGVDHFVLGEVEQTFSAFISDLESGTARRMYPAPAEEDMPPASTVPIPRFDLTHMDAYQSMPVQFSRGCPFRCDFCDIWKLYGNLPRTKNTEQVLAELTRLYDVGWRGQVFFVDDNFIGNWKKALDVLRAIEVWQKEHGFPFDFYTEASVNLALHDELVSAMVAAGFTMVFIGLETPNPEALQLMNKKHNVKKDDPDFLLHAVEKLQRAGLEVTCGLIAGVDGDDETSFDRIIAFVRESRIASAMYGILTVIKGTDLYEKMRLSGRLLQESSGSNTDTTLNYVPHIDPVRIAKEYQRVLSTIYDETLSNYFERCHGLLKRLKVVKHTKALLWKIKREELRAGWRSFRKLCFSRTTGPAYRWFLLKTLLMHPAKLPLAMRLAVKGYDHERHTREVVVALGSFKEESRKQFSEYKEFVAGVLLCLQEGWVETIKEHTASLLWDMRLRVHELRGCREGAHAHLEMFRREVRSYIQQATGKVLSLDEVEVTHGCGICDRAKEVISLNSQIDILCSN